MSNIVRLKKFLETIKKYDNYLYKHGGDILLTILSLISIIVLFSYVGLKKKAYYYKRNWAKYRCDPGITPFAGFINSPEGSGFSDKVDYTIQNFTKCNHEIMRSNIAGITNPLKHTSSLLQVFFVFLMKIALSIKYIVLKARDKLLKILDSILQKIFNIVIEFTSFFSIVKDTLMKIAGVFINVLFLIVAYGYTLVTFLYNIVRILITYILILVLIIIIMFIIYGLCKLAALYPPLTIVMLAIANQLKVRFIIPTIITLTIKIIILIVVTVGTSYVAGAVMEQERRCFYEDTLIETENAIKKIRDLKPGDKLKNNNIVESIIKLDNINQECLYKINDVYVTGGHYVYSNREGWKQVENSKNATKTEFIPDVLFCLVTSKKEIIINNTKFSDWDDLENHDLMYFKNTFNITETDKLNNKINSVLHPNTKIHCKNTIKYIKDIKKGDILADGSKVFGIIKSLPPEITMKYKLNSTEIIGKNIHFNNLGDYLKIKHEIFKDVDSKHYYHLLTSSRSIKIENVDILDYNGCVENILDNRLQLE